MHDRVFFAHEGPILCINWCGSDSKWLYPELKENACHYGILYETATERLAFIESIIDMVCDEDTRVLSHCQRISTNECMDIFRVAALSVK